MKAYLICRLELLKGIFDAMPLTCRVTLGESFNFPVSLIFFIREGSLRGL